ncbi:hypothetical protein D9613_003449 [Agrocybe pediades]|uniref:Uncharacterized protein n=1 Tax=Agrocybe pediades TaxID=84607 RepID=A0A8H4QPI3_9AGAR|nr:hypothetical protein D9613_003449 [Agrocybe pediades]
MDIDTKTPSHLPSAPESSHPSNGDEPILNLRNQNLAFSNLTDKNNAPNQSLESADTLPEQGNESEFNLAAVELEDILADSAISRKPRPLDSIKSIDDEDEEEGGSFELSAWV